MKKPIRFFVKKEKIVRDRSEKILMIIVFPLLLLWSFTLLYPFFWAFLNSFKSTIEYYRNSFSFPEKWMFENWTKAIVFLEVPKSDPWESAGFIELLWNSIWRTFGDAIIYLMSVSVLSYVISKYSNPWTKAIYVVSLTVMMLPIIGAMPSYYRLNAQLGLINTPLRLILGIGSGIGGMEILVMISFFSGISWTYAEAVFIDGGGHWTVFLKVMLPQAIPILIALFVTRAISSWNDYLGTLMYMPDFPTLASGLYIIENASLTANNRPLYFACMLYATIPPVALYWGFNGKIMNNVSIGGIKG